MRGALGISIALLSAAPCLAQIADYPADVAVSEAPARIYTTPDHHTLYFYPTNIARSRAGVTLTYCTGPCEKIWTVLKPSADAKPVGNWKIITGAQGAQLAFKGNPVFTLAGEAAGERRGQGYDDIWFTMPYVPPQPRLIAPPAITAQWQHEAYVLMDKQGHRLYTGGAGIPLAAGMASLPIGDWAVQNDAEGAHWLWRGQAVFVADENGTLPKGAQEMTL